MPEDNIRTIGDLESPAPDAGTPRLSEPDIRLPDADDPTAPNSPGIAERHANAGQTELTVVERITQLEQMHTNFIFPFGRSNSGKTVVMSSLIHYMSSVESGGRIHAWGSDYGSADDTHNYVREVNRMFRTRMFPGRTAFGALHWDRTRHVNLDFVPNDRSRRRLRLTFVDMAGDDHQAFAEGDGRDGLPPGIEIFFQANGLSLTFVLVTQHLDANVDDEMMVSFLDHLTEIDPRFEHARILLLVSQWDTYHGEDSIETFVQERMPMTYARTLNPHNAMINFTIGSVGTVPGKVPPEPFLTAYDPEPARIVLDWLYHTHTGSPLVHVPWWKKLLRSV